MPTRVLVLAPHLSRSHAGAAHATIDICNALASAEWADVSAFAYSRDADALDPAVRFIQGHQRREPRLFWRLPSLYRVRFTADELRKAALPPADLCYTQSTVMGLAYRRLFPHTPIVSHTGHVLVDREFREESAGGRSVAERLEARLLNRTELRAYAAPAWTHVVSTKLVARQRTAHYQLPDDFFVVRPLGVDERRFDPTVAHPDVRERLGIRRDAFVVTTVARLVPWKNIDCLMRAIAAAAVEMELVVVGDGPDRARLQSVAEEQRISHRIHFVGHVTPTPYLAAADVFALPSLIESFGMVYAEAMLMGLPCIGLRNDPPRVLSSAMDVIPEGLAGYCVADEVELRDRLEGLAGSIELRTRLATGARALACEMYTVRSYAEFLRGIVAGGSVVPA